MSNPVPSAAAALPLDWLVTPSLAFTHPDDVLSQPGLTTAERRAILASWASDAHAVEDAPWLRQLECGARIPLGEVLAALRALDMEETGAGSPTRKQVNSLWACSRSGARVTHSAR
jgi:hypothetical protein